MTLQQLNQCPSSEAKAALSNCCGSTQWVNLILAHRPFENKMELYRKAEQVWYMSCKEADWREAFTHHPKIGDMENLKKKFAHTHQWSGQEQAGIQAAEESTLHALAEGNRAYEAKFGYIFIVCATGKTAAEMLALLENRLPNDPQQEIHIAMEEQHKITIIRLDKLLNN